MRALLLTILWPSIALADLDPYVKTDRPQAAPLAVVQVPCLREADERRYVVTWWIEDKTTGERRDPGSQQVRRRC